MILIPTPWPVLVIWFLVRRWRITLPVLGIIVAGVVYQTQPWLGAGLLVITIGTVLLVLKTRADYQRYVDEQADLEYERQMAWENQQ